MIHWIPHVLQYMISTYEYSVLFHIQDDTNWIFKYKDSRDSTILILCPTDNNINVRSFPPYSRNHSHLVKYSTILSSFFMNTILQFYIQFINHSSLKYLYRVSLHLIYPRVLHSNYCPLESRTEPIQYWIQNILYPKQQAYIDTLTNNKESREAIERNNRYLRNNRNLQEPDV